MTKQTKLLKIECAAECGFLIRSHTPDEVYATAIDHCKDEHGKAITMADAKQMAIPA